MFFSKICKFGPDVTCILLLQDEMLISQDSKKCELIKFAWRTDNREFGHSVVRSSRARNDVSIIYFT